MRSENVPDLCNKLIITRLIEMLCNVNIVVGKTGKKNQDGTQLLLMELKKRSS